VVGYGPFSLWVNPLGRSVPHGGDINRQMMMMTPYWVVFLMLVLFGVFTLIMIVLQKPPTTVRIFDRNDYYSVHGIDAQTAAREVFSSIANIKRMGIEPNKLDYLVLSKGNFEILIKKLLLVSCHALILRSQRARNMAFLYLFSHYSLHIFINFHFSLSYALLYTVL
jgi:hypothetical protein